MKRFLIIDGNSIINRAFYGIRPLSNRDGLPTNAVYGFLSIIKRHLDSLRPDYLAVAFDVHEPTFRHKAYDGYKAGRRAMPDELRVQMPYAKKIAAALGFLVIESPGYEADDIIGTAAAFGDADGDIKTYILTGDRDSLQLISDRTSVVLAKNKEDVLFDRTQFVSEYGIQPEQFVDVKALMGDSSDNIPGVRGIGEKTALALIKDAGSLDSLYASEDFFGATKSVSAKLSDGKDSAYMSQMLATICREAPIPSPDELFSARETDVSAFSALCSELDFVGMPRRFGIDATAARENDTAGDRNGTEESLTVEKVTSLGGKHYSSPVCFYTDGETAVVTTDGKTVVSAPYDRDDVVAFLSENTVICHDYKALLRTLSVPFETVNCSFDTKIAAYLLNPGKKYALEDIAIRYIGHEPKNAEGSVAAVAKISGIMAGELETAGMTALMKEIELPLSGVLAGMEERGFKIDVDGIRGYAKELLREENAVSEAIWLQAGHQFNINSPKQLGEVLFDEIKLPAGKKNKNGYVTDAETLEELRPYHTIISDVLMFRQISKLRGTYGDSLADQADENGRIHTFFNQTGTATGRLASSDPNLQNIPVRGEIGRELRRFFVADDGYVLIDADYSQIELRILAELSKDKNMCRAFIEGEDIHTAVASEVFGISPDEVTPELRRRAKAVNFGIVYGIGEFSLSKDIGTTRKAAKEYIENYLATYRGVDLYLKKTVEDAKTNGYTTTAFGRRRNIPELKAANKVTRSFGERVAMNSPIQGSAADVIKIAMINVASALKRSGLDAHLIMQVHDELIVEAREDCAEAAAEILIREMENAVKTAVPLTADCGIGKTWLDAK